MNRPESYAFWTVPFESEMERLQNQLLLSWEQEAQKLALLGLQDGMTVAELGSGPGFVTEQLLRLLPQSQIIAVELALEMVTYARHYLAGKEEHRWRIIQASVMQMPLPDASVDFAYARYLFQHLADPVGCAREVWRILKPGGTFAILDIDVAWSRIVEPETPGRLERLQRFAKKQKARGGNRAIGRRLPRILQAGGFIDPRLEVVIIHSDIVGLEPFLRADTPNPERARALIAAGEMTQEQFQADQEASEAFMAAPDKLLMSGLLLGCGTKPAG